MAWTKFRDLFRHTKMSEAHFVLGIDLGDATSSIAYYDALRQQPEVIDMSGGYGKPAMPTVLQYAPDTKEWVFGEYAVLNRGIGRAQTFSGLLARLGRNEYVDVNDRPVQVSALLGLFCKELVSACRSLNPKAEIAGIVAAVPSYMTEEARAELLAAFHAAGLDKDLIELLPDRECVFLQHYANRPPAAEKTLLLDFGSRALRGGIYDVCPDADEAGVAIDCVSSLFDDTIGVAQVNARVLDWFTEFYGAQKNEDTAALPKAARDSLHVFAHQHRDLLFQREIGAKPLKLYYNFAYPPLQQAVSAEDVHALSAPFADAFTRFLTDVFAKTIHGGTATAHHEIGTVLCTGGGFEMLWARKLVQATFPDSKIVFFKNSKSVVAEGASLAAAAQLGVSPPRNQRLTDRHMLTADVGVKILRGQKERFVPLAERNSFWWQTREPVCFLLNEPTSDDTSIEFFTRDEAGELHALGRAGLDGLPERPAGTTKLRLSFQFDSRDSVSATIADAGFGDLFPRVDYEKTISFQM